MSKNFKFPNFQKIWKFPKNKNKISKNGETHFFLHKFPKTTLNPYYGKFC